MQRLLPHVLIFLAVMIYIILGGLAFMYFEQLGFRNRTTDKVNLTMEFESPSLLDFANLGCDMDGLEIMLKSLKIGCCTQDVNLKQNGVTVSKYDECFDAIQRELNECFMLMLNKLEETERKLSGQAVNIAITRLDKPEMTLKSAIVLAFTVRQLQSMSR